MANPNWVKGVSGNPGGRPKGYAAMQAAARSHTAAAIKALVASLKDERNRVAAATALLDRGWGKPAQPTTGEGGEGPIRYLVQWLTVREPTLTLTAEPEKPEANPSEKSQS